MPDLHFLADLWDDAEAERLAGSSLDLLRYRSNLLGADLRITNFGGGNTSSKFDMPDPLTGTPAHVMAVKGSGGDLRSIGTAGFAILYMEKRKIPALAGPQFLPEADILGPVLPGGEAARRPKAAAHGAHAPAHASSP